jgi:thiol-disulfide isomerase/thioredoxin
MTTILAAHRVAFRSAKGASATGLELNLGRAARRVAFRSAKGASATGLELNFGRAVLILVFLSAAALAGEQREIRGRVVDEKGVPLAGAVIDCYWRANGTGKDRDGKRLDIKIEENVKKFWADLGEMEPAASSFATTAPDGKFSLTIPESHHAMMAMDRERRRGGIATLPKGKEHDPIEIRVGPLIKVRASLRGPAPNQKPSWSHVYVQVPQDPTRPLDSTRLVSCGSFDARFEVSLPPGRYVLHGYNDALDAFLVPDKTIDLAAGAGEVDLGVLMLSDAMSAASTKIDHAKSVGDWVDVAGRYGKTAPPWHITDARGIPRNAQIKDFKGKWVMVYFWGLSCAPCQRTGLPALAQFYAAHAADRDRFEIVAFCIDDDGQLTSMAALDRALEPVVKHVWGGKPLPFPVALDASLQTMQSFGISTFGPQLIDPDGNLIQGDEAVLAEKLKRSER